MVAGGDDGFDSRVPAAVDDIFFRQQMGSGDDSGSEFVESYDGEPGTGSGVSV